MTPGHAFGLLAVAGVLAIGGVVRGSGAPRRVGSSTPDPIRAASPRHAAVVVTAVVITLGVAAIALGPSPAIALVAVTGVVLTRRRREERRVRRERIEAAFPDAVELLVLCLHAGRSPVQAVHELARRAPAPVRPGFVAVIERLARGDGLADALGALPATLGSCTREVATAIATADRDGLALAPVLDRLAAEARATRRRLGEAAARKLPVRLSFPLVACTLPAFVLLALAPALLGAVSTLRGSTP